MAQTDPSWRRVRNHNFITVLLAAMLMLCCAKPDGHESAGAQTVSDGERSAREILMLGPNEVSSATERLAWGMTVGLVSTPIWFPWLAYDAIAELWRESELVFVVRGQEGHVRFEDSTRPSLVSASWSAADIAVPPIEFGSYHALIVGNDDYRHLRKLKNAVADADAIATLLRDGYGFETTVLRNATRAALLSKLFEFREKLNFKDNLLIYYAGHGYIDPDTEEGYWLPIDARENDPTHWLANSTLSTMLKGIDAKHILLIADSCFAGSLHRSNFSRSRQTDYVSTLNSKTARVVMTSGGLEPVLDSDGKGHSVFAKYLLRALSDNNGVIDANSVFLTIRRSVIENAHQTPQYGPIRFTGHDGGDFLFVKLGEAVLE